MTDDKVLLNPRWITEMELDPTSGEIDINLGMKRLYYLVKSIISIRDGGEVYRSGEPLVDAIIPAYLGQAQIMDEVREKQQKEKRNSLPKKEFDQVIYSLAMAGHDGPEIRRILEEEYGIIRANGDFVYKRDGWKRAMKDKIQLNSVEK